MQMRVTFWLLAVSWAAAAGTFGSVVVIGGHAADLALDERRGVLYVANYTANRIEVVSTGTREVVKSINVAKQPASVALSPDGRYLVVAHYGNFAAPNAGNLVSVHDLDGGVTQTLTMASPPLAAAFGNDGLALVVTTKEIVLVNPVDRSIQVLSTIEELTASELPETAPKFPPEIIRASAAPSGDGRVIYGLAEMGSAETSLIFRYDVDVKALYPYPNWSSSPPLGPRVVSVNQDGSLFLTGWVLRAYQGAWRPGTLYHLAQFRDNGGMFNIGSHAIDSARGLIYAQMNHAATATAPAPTCSTVGGVQVCVTPPSTTAPTTAAPTGPPVLMVTDADNLTVRERLVLPENLAGKSVLSASGDMMYAISDSGLMFLPVGSLNQSPRVAASVEDVVFRGTFCNRRVLAQEVEIADPGGGKTDFSLRASDPGIVVTPDSGTTPARVRIAVDPTAFAGYNGTYTGTVAIQSKAAVNVPAPIRVLVNNREPDQRGTVVNVPGRVVDLLADPARSRFYALRQDKNQVLVFDSTTYQQIATLRTGNTPMRMAVTLDGRRLLVGNDDSQLANVYNLDTLETEAPVLFPGGHYPRSIAASGGAILAASRVAGPAHTIDRIDLWARRATELPSLGIYKNDVDIDTVLAASPSGGSIFAAQANGVVMRYDAGADTFVAARQDVKSLAGAYAALSDSHFVAGDALLNGSLVTMQTFGSAGTATGFALADQYGVRTTAASAAGAGRIERMELPAGRSISPTRMTEAPVAPETAGMVTGTVFTRTVATLADRSAMVALTQSGVTVLPWNYDAAVRAPTIASITSAADGSGAVASGGLVTVAGSDLSLTIAATQEVPRPTALADSCLTVNGVLAPMVMISPQQINAQLPFEVSGTATVVLRTQAGVSNSFKVQVASAAPTVFRGEQDTAMVVRKLNGELVTPSNPIHPEDTITIYATGLGMTSPAVENGYPGPEEPPASALARPEVTLGGMALTVEYAGLAAGEVGVYQIRARVPYGVREGMNEPLTIAQGGNSTTLGVRVVR